MTTHHFQSRTFSNGKSFTISQIHHMILLNLHAVINDFTPVEILYFPGSSDGKESTCNVGDPRPIPELGRSPGGRHGNPLQYSCLKNPQGQWSLEGYSPCSHKESDTTEWLSTQTLLCCLMNPFHPSTPSKRGTFSLQPFLPPQTHSPLYCVALRS